MNILQWVSLKILGYAYIGRRRRPGWSGALPFYRFRCKVHGIVENYPQGYAEILRCPKCDEESRGEANKRTEEAKENVQQ